MSFENLDQKTDIVFDIVDSFLGVKMGFIGQNLVKVISSIKIKNPEFSLKSGFLVHPGGFEPPTC